MEKIPTYEEIKLELDSIKPSSVSKKSSIGDLNVLRDLFFNFSLENAPTAKIFSKNIRYKIKECKSAYEEISSLSYEVSDLTEFGNDLEIVKKKFGTEGVRKLKKCKRRLKKLDTVIDEILEVTAPDVFHVAAEFVAHTLSLTGEIERLIQAEDNQIKADKKNLQQQSQSKSFFKVMQPFFCNLVPQH
jgi:hypothetical protein